MVFFFKLEIENWSLPFSLFSLQKEGLHSKCHVKNDYFPSKLETKADAVYLGSL